MVRTPPVLFAESEKEDALKTILTFVAILALSMPTLFAKGTNALAVVTGKIREAKGQ